MRESCSRLPHPQQTRCATTERDTRRALHSRGGILLVHGRTSHEKRLNHLSRACATFVRSDLGVLGQAAEGKSWWPLGFCSRARSHPAQVGSVCQRARRSDLSDAQRVFDPAGPEAIWRRTPGRLVCEISQLRTERWGPRVQARAALASRAKTEQYEALCTHLQPVLHWLRTTTSIADVRAACEAWLARSAEIASPSSACEAGALRSLNARQLLLGLKLSK